MSGAALSALIIGGDSVIGQALRPVLEERGITVDRTSRRDIGAGSRVIVLDLASPGADEVRKERRFDVAVFCAGVTSLRACQADPAGSRQVNLVGTEAVARALARAGTFIVYLSTNLVFDGMTPAPNEDALVCPRTEYGRQKAEAEARMGNLGVGVAIIRMTKILHRHGLPAADWLRELRAGRPIRVTSDAPVSILGLSEAVGGIAAVAANRAAGIWHFSNREDRSYYELAVGMSRQLGVQAGLVKPVPWAETIGPAVHRPAYAVLGTSRTSRALNLDFSDTDSVIRSLTGAALS